MSDGPIYSLPTISNPFSDENKLFYIPAWEHFFRNINSRSQYLTSYSGTRPSGYLFEIRFAQPLRPATWNVPPGGTGEVQSPNGWADSYPSSPVTDNYCFGFRTYGMDGAPWTSEHRRVGVYENGPSEPPVPYSNRALGGSGYNQAAPILGRKCLNTNEIWFAYAVVMASTSRFAHGSLFNRMSLICQDVHYILYDVYPHIRDLFSIDIGGGWSTLNMCYFCNAAGAEFYDTVDSSYDWTSLQEIWRFVNDAHDALVACNHCKYIYWNSTP